MYLPSHFHQQSLSVLHDLIRNNPLATLITGQPGSLDINHIPFILDEDSGILRGHVARQNPVWQHLGETSI